MDPFARAGIRVLIESDCYCSPAAISNKGRMFYYVSLIVSLFDQAIFSATYIYSEKKKYVRLQLAYRF